jgi:hypothetical protein
MFRALLAHPQKALHKRNLVCVLLRAYVSWLWRGCSETPPTNRSTILRLNRLLFECTNIKLLRNITILCECETWSYVIRETNMD